MLSNGTLSSSKPHPSTLAALLLFGPEIREEKKEEKKEMRVPAVRLCGQPLRMLVHLDEAMIQAAGRGCLHAVRTFKEWGATDFKGAASAALQAGHGHIVKTCLEWEPGLSDDMLLLAAEVGDKTILQSCAECKASDFQGAMAAAAGKGHSEAMEFCRVRGATALGNPILLAASAGQTHIIRLVESWRCGEPLPYNEMMCRAAQNGHEGVVNHCRIQGATDFNGALFCAAEGGHENLVKLCKKWGATSAVRDLALAVSAGESLPRLIMSWW